jgi:hypothetical protein
MIVTVTVTVIVTGGFAVMTLILDEEKRRGEKRGEEGRSEHSSDSNSW